jgi:putative DNA primase/helicase
VKATGAPDSHAVEAARTVGGKVAMPDFGTDRDPDMKDMNDLAVLCGAAAVERAIAGASAPDRAEVQPNEGNVPAPATEDEEAITRLVRLSALEYDRCRKDEAERMNVRPATLDKLVAGARKAEGDDGMDFPDIDPWPHPVEPAQLLNEIIAAIRRFIVCDRETADATALWTVLTWLIDVVQIAPLAVITAPEKRCGKSQLLFVLNRMVRRPLAASNVTPAALFRAIDAWKPTLLVDEADAFMRENEELRGILNAGHTRDSAYVVRVVGDEHRPQRFSVWGCKALAGIGHVADTLMDRAIVLELRRKLPHEQVQRLRHAEPNLFDDIASKLARFADDYRDAIRRARPVLPAELHDRAQDNWEPLLAIADVAGGEWPDLARKAAKKLSGGDSPTMTTGTELLDDIKAIFESKQTDRISTHDLITALCADAEAPWATYNHGREISPRQVAKRLSDYGIVSHTIRIGPDTPKGYMRSSFDEVFSRYLPSTPAASATPPQTGASAGFHVADTNHVAATRNQSATPRPAPDGRCGGVADKRVGGEGAGNVAVVV